MEVDEIWLHAVEMLAKGKREAALRAFGQACQLDLAPAPDYVVRTATPQIWLERGLIFLRRTVYSASRECLNRAVDGDPSLLEGWLNLAIVSLRLGENESALPLLERAEELAPDDARVYQWKSNVLNLAGRHPEALVAADRCLELDPKSVFAIVMRAQANEKTERFTAALADYRSAFAHAPENNQVKALIVRTLEAGMNSQTPVEEVVGFCQQFREEVEPSDSRVAWSYMQEGLAQWRGGELEAAQESLKISYARGQTEAGLFIAELLHSQGKTQEALENLPPSQRPSFWQRALKSLSPGQIEGRPGDLSDPELEALLKGSVETAEGGDRLHLGVEIGGGLRLSAILATTPTLHLLCCHRERYREARWPVQADPSGDTDWSQGEVRWDQVDPTMLSVRRGVGPAPKTPTLKESWGMLRRSLQAADPTAYKSLRAKPPKQQPETAQEVHRAGLLDGRCPEGLLHIVNYWIKRAGPEFAVEAVAELDSPSAWSALRRLLARLPAKKYKTALEQAGYRRERCRTPEKRYWFSFCFPEQKEWASQDWSYWLETVDEEYSGWCLLSCAPAAHLVGKLLQRKALTPEARFYFPDLVTALGTQATPALFRLFDASTCEGSRLRAAHALSWIDSEPVRQFFHKQANQSELKDMAHHYLNTLHPGWEPLPQPGPEFRDPSLREVLHRLVGEDPTREQLGALEELEISELSLARSASKSVTSLDGIEHCTGLKALKLHASQAVSLSPLKGLRRLEFLHVGPPRDPDPSWNLVRVSDLEALHNLTRLSLPMDAELNPDYGNLLKRVQARARNLESDEHGKVDYQGFTPERRNQALDQLQTAMGEAFTRPLTGFGLSQNDREVLYQKLTAAALYFNSPALAGEQAALFQESLAPIVQELLYEVEDGLDWEKTALEAVVEWLTFGHGANVSGFISANIPEVNRYFLHRLEDRPLVPATVNWFQRGLHFEKTLERLGPFQDPPLLDLEHSCLSWRANGELRAASWVTLLGILDNTGVFTAGWCDRIVPTVAGPRLGVPASLEVSAEQAMELARVIADGETGIIQTVQNPGGTLFLQVSNPGELAEGVQSNMVEPGAIDGELWSKLLSVLDLLEGLRLGDDLDQAQGLIADIAARLRDRAGLYWHNTRAGDFFLELASQLEGSHSFDPEEYFLAVRGCADRWRRQIEEWKPEPTPSGS